MTGRRGLWLLAALAGCGLHPVYAPPDPAAAARLSAVDVAIIPERQGQLLRQALQARLQRGQVQAPQFVLQTEYGVAQEGIAITNESSITRIRLVATATYVLRPVGDAARTCTSGTTRQVDGVDVENQQYFASDLETETAQRRLAEATANEIALKLAIAAGRAGTFGCET